MIKELAKCIREYKRDSLKAPIMVSLEVVMECIIPFVIANLVNEIKAGCAFSVILQYGIALVLMSGLSLFFGASAGSACATASCGFAKNVRKDMFYRIQSYSFQNIDKFSTSSLVTRLTTDISNVQLAYMMIIRVAIRCPLMLIFSFVMAFVMGGKMGVIFVIVVPLLGIGLILVTRTTMPLFRRVFKKYDALNSSIQENIKGIRVVKSFVREDYEKKKFHTAAEDVCRDFTKAERILALNGPMMQLCMYMVMIFVLYFGSRTIILTKGVSLDVGQFSALLTYNFQILSSLMMLSMVFVMITMAQESAERIVEVLTEESTLSNPENPVYEVKDGSIDFDDVSFKYRANAKKMALADINLHIRSGETIGIIGGTGTSKTSLIQLISRLYDATEGTVKVGGLDVRNYDLNTLRDQVSVVLQKNVLFSGTIKDNLRWGNKNATDEEMIEACKLAQADEFITQFPDGYDTYIEQGGSNVSGGQKQRLSIARAIAKSPKIFLFDDSFSALDYKTDAQLRKALHDKTADAAVIIVAQRISTILHANRILVLEDGRVVGDGTHEQLLESCAAYQEIARSQLSEAELKGGRAS